MNTHSKLTHNDNENTIIPKKLTYQEYLNKIIMTFPIYYNVFKKYYLEGTNVAYELDRLYQPLFIGLLEYYNEFMTNNNNELSGIEQIIITVKNKYNPDLPYAIIDYIEYLFGNVLYETFLTEIKKIPEKSISYEYLCVFEYIIRSELHKYKLYKDILDNLKKSVQTDDSDNMESKLTNVFEHRINKCLNKMSFSLGLLEKYYPTYTNIIDLCKKIISDSEYDLIGLIDTNIASNINSFMEIKNYN